MKIWALLLTAVMAVGCTETRIKNVDVPDTALMDLPKLGYKATYTYKYSDSSGETSESAEPINLLCLTKRHTSGQAFDYCGFTTRVSEDAFSFDMLEYPTYGFFGLLLISIEGSGDNSEAVININGRDVNNYTYTIEYEITHTAEVAPEDLGLPAEESAASISKQLPRDPKFFLWE